jgi:nucleotide-binding universal stress UspA family protein
MSPNDRERAALDRIEVELSGDHSRHTRRLTRKLTRRRARGGPIWGAGSSNGAPPPDVDLSKTIVVGCDGHPTGDAALRFAYAEAQLRSVPLIVFTTFLHPVDPDRDDILTTETELRGRVREATELALSRALPVPDDRLPPHRLVTGSGEPSSLLLRHYGGAALIVVGERHRSLAHRLVHGAPMLAKLIKHGHVPVVVVPPD